MVGRTVGNLQIVEKLGEGGMGTVYRAVDQLVQRNVAIKVLKPEHAGNQEVYERFHTEAVALARLNHPAIATLYSFFRESGDYYMVMEFVPGKNLDCIIQSHGPLGWQSSCTILMRVLDGMRHAHSQGIVHRDLKPANIMLTPEGAVKITDFGIARMFYAPKLTRDQGVIGTVGYLAPERILGREADARSDVYSLGMVFYEIATGRLPFNTTTEFALMRAQVELKPSSFAELGMSMPAAVEQAVLRALEKDPQLRPQNAGNFAEELAAALQGSGVELRSLGGAFNLGAKETSTSFVPRDTGFSAVGLPPIPKETVYVRPAMETAYIAGAKETVVVPLMAAMPMQTVTGPRPAQRSRKLMWAVPAILLAVGLGVLGFIQLSKRPPEPPIIPTASGPMAAASAPVSSPVPPPPADPSPEPAVTPDVKPAVVPAVLAVKPEAKPPSKPDVKPAVVPDVKVPVTPPDPAIDLRPPPPPERVVEPPSVQRLADVRKLYLRPGPTSEFDGFLREKLESEVGSLIVLTTSAAKADAVMLVSIEDQRANSVTGPAGRALGLKSGKIATVVIQDASGRHQLWKAVIADRHSIATAMRDDMKRLASRIAKKLRSDLR